MPLYKLCGQGPRLAIHLENPVYIEDGENWSVALVGFFTDNYYNNLKVADKVYFIDSNEKQNIEDDAIKSKSFEPGFYTLETLQSELRSFIATFNTKVNVDEFKMMKFGNHVAISSPLRFYLGPNISQLLGFVKTNQSSPPNNTSTFFAPENLNVGTLLPNMRPMEVIELHCNLVENSCVTHEETACSHKHLETEILYTFFPTAPNGFKISQVPSHRHYVPIKPSLKKIQYISVTVMDGNQRLLEANNAVDSIVYLHIAPINTK